jgi:predicted transcriptional regulator
MSHPLRKFRQAHKPELSLGKIAEEAGTTRATVSRIELGSRAPSLTLAAKLSNATKKFATKKAPALPLEAFLPDRSAAE